MVGSALLRCSLMQRVCSVQGAALRRAAAAPAALRPSRRPQQASRRAIHTTIVAQSLQKTIVTEGTGATPKQGDRVRHASGGDALVERKQRWLGSEVRAEG